MGRAPHRIDPGERQRTRQYQARHGIEVSRQERTEAATLRESARRSEEAGLVQLAVPAILAGLLSSLPSMLHVVKLCDQCHREHFTIRPGNMNPCNRVECECWCTQGTGQ